MFTELMTSLTGNNIGLGLAQAAAAMVLSLAVVLLARRFAVHAERETMLSLVRGLVQMALVGVILAFLLQGSLLVGVLILLGMTFAAAATASHRAKGTPDALLLSFYAIAAGSRIGVAGRLAAEPAVAVAPYVQSAVYASLVPRLDMLKSLGLVWIPGVMAGMLLSGASPIYAGIYQFIVVAMILAASGLTGLVATLLIRSRAFSPAGQLLLRPGEPRQPAPVPAMARQAG